MTLNILNQKDYLKRVRNWNYHSPAEQAELRAWYSSYYKNNKESEQNRYREYYLLHSDKEKERVKHSRKLNANQISKI